MKNKIIHLGLLLFALIFALGACNKKTETVTPNDLFGSWKTIIGENEYISFDVDDIDYTYSAYTYNRLASSGTWEIEGDKLILTYDYDGSTVVYSVKIDNDTLYLNEGEEKYVRFDEDLASKIEKRILDEILENFDLGFTIQENIEFPWNVIDENNQIISENLDFEVISYQHIFKTADFAEISESETAIVDYLSNKGFISDTLNVSETNASFKKGNIVVVINISSNPEPIVGDTAYVNVMSSIIE